jgi:sarcosine oxidase
MTVTDGYGQHNSGDFLQNTYDAADKYGIRHEKLTNEQIKSRFPQFNIRSDERGYYEPEAGYLRPEKCIEAQLELAKKHGAILNLNEKVSGFETQAFYDRYVKEQFPHLTNKCVKAATCMYTDTPDARFVIDFHPNHQNVIVASPCSGHGFKHSAAIGEVLSQLTQTGKSDIDISKFSLSRFK